MKLTYPTIIAFFFISLISFSCKKDSNSGTSNPTGYWKGSFGSGSNPQTMTYALLFRANGTLRVYAQYADTVTASKAEGTYSVSGRTIVTNYTFFQDPLTGTFSSNATANSTDTRMSGTFGTGTNATGAGNFTVDRQ